MGLCAAPPPYTHSTSPIRCWLHRKCSCVGMRTVVAVVVRFSVPHTTAHEIRGTLCGPAPWPWVCNVPEV